MRVAFDHQIFFAQTYGGISRYYTRLAEHLSLLGHEPRVFAPLHRNRHLNELSRRVSRGIYLEAYPRRTGRLIGLFNSHLARARIRGWNPDVVHETYFAEKRSGTRRMPTVITVYDMIHELYPDQMPPDDATSARKLESVRRADHVICISENTRKDLLRLHRAPPEKVSVVHLGVDEPVALVAEGAQAPLADDHPFILYVGARSGYKNFAGLIRAFAASTSLRADFRIVAFGGGEFSRGERQLIDTLGLSGTIVQIGGSDQVMRRLYGQARAFVYPSLYEGFGLPPLEAMAYGCPVLTGSVSSMPEVVGNAAELFDPTDVESMCRSIESVVYSESHRHALIARGFERIKDFSWTRCAKETLKIYRGVAS